MAYPKRSQTSTADSDLKEDGVPSRKPGASAAGGKGIAPASPMLGNASNPNKADIPERKKSSTVPSVSVAGLYGLPGSVGLKWRDVLLLCPSLPTKPCPLGPRVQCRPVGITSFVADVSYCMHAIPLDEILHVRGCFWVLQKCLRDAKTAQSDRKSIKAAVTVQTGGHSRRILSRTLWGLTARQEHGVCPTCHRALSIQNIDWALTLCQGPCRVLCRVLFHVSAES